MCEKIVVSVLPKVFGQHFLLMEEIVLLNMTLRILCGALAGVGCGALSLLWIRSLLAQRERSYDLARKEELLLTAAAAAAGGALGALIPGWIPPVCGLLLLIAALTVSVTDWMHRIIPNPVVLAIMGLKLAAGLPALLGARGFLPFSPVQSLLGLAVCFAVFELPGLFKKHVGAGDVKLAAAVGFFLGLDYALLAIVIMGILVVGYCVFQNKAPFLAFLRTEIPMGPFIAVGLLAAFVLSMRIA